MVSNKVNPKKRSQPYPRVPRDSFITTHSKQAKMAFSALWQRPLGNLLTLAVISMALALPASLYLLTKNIASVAVNVTSPSQVSVYLQQGTPESRVMILKDQLESRPDIALVDYISPQQGLAELSQYAGFDQAISLLDEYALPGVLVITPSVEDNQQIKRIAEEARQQANVTDVRLDEDWLARLDAIRHLAMIIVVSLSILMLSSIFLIIGNTLRFNVQANKDEIQTMKLIGATDSYILRPYLYSGMWLGLLGSLSAWLLTALVTIILNGAVAELATLYDSRFRLIGLNWDESLLLLMLGTLLGCLAARLSAQRHLKEIEPL
ncbi:cell division protein FtsX [Vibrio metschnikovii]|uniref:permease-like cell division protein FtsX n=1 Tax=Vibrio metschnikovii TaxID=28172 RepID=UPI002A436822|nr:cell division protein FtsX [Vibrio metschnikovii]EKO3691110.1 cell division protein FtsX [Vibrio metschnikovii]EKO3780415.1 cell division protein FtsX [Vibrio metschnikovii]EKO3888317.1 cell division protein FtsX [Vibrio metschnikovii]EKO3891351.1 cell division protein FtsX [Vibrio metschnikovii]